MISENARKGSLQGLLQELSDVISRKIECKLPCVVISVLADRMRVTVRPLIRVVDVSGASHSRDVIEGVPVFQYGAGDTLLSFPVKVGDIGWLEAADRDLGVFLQGYNESIPPSRRKHSFSDGVFVPDLMTNFAITGEDADAVTLQNRNGTVRIALDQGQIRIVNGASRVEINADNVIINGATITQGGDVITAAGVSLNNHYHTQGNDSDGDAEQDTSPSVATE